MPSSITSEALQQHAEQEWSQLRLKFLDRLWIGVLVVALMAAPVSVARSYFTGWVDIYAFHLAFLAIVVAGFLGRKQLSYNVRAVLIIALMDLSAIGGILSFSLLGSAWWWMLMAGLLAGLLFTRRIGIIHTLLGVLFLFGMAYAYSTGVLAIDFDANEYVMLPVSWATLLSGPVLLTLCGFWAIGLFFDTAHEQLLELDRRRQQKALLVKQLEASLEEVKTLSGLIPMCMHCKKIRDDAGFWENVEAFVSRHTDAKFTHALCQPCGVELYGELWHSAMRDSS
jgi:hypothetical protein